MFYYIFHRWKEGDKQEDFRNAVDTSLRGKLVPISSKICGTGLEKCLETSVVKNAAVRMLLCHQQWFPICLGIQFKVLVLIFNPL